MSKLLAKDFKQNISNPLIGSAFNYLSGENEMEQKKWLKELEKYVGESKPRPNHKRPDFPIGVHIWGFKPKLGKYFKGVSAFGWRTFDGCVSCVLDDFPETKENPVGCGVGTPSMLFDHEYQYFSNNPKKFLAWVRTFRVDNIYKGAFKKEDK